MRSACGVFDVSHMGEVETSGPEAGALLQRLLSNDLSKLEVGGAQYSVLCREDGGILDDLFTYRLADDRYLTVTNAANHERDLAWFAEHAAGFDAEVRDAIGDYAMLAVQGPEARSIVAGAGRRRAAAAHAHGEPAAVAGAETLVCGTGYTGEDGVELLFAPERAGGLGGADGRRRDARRARGPRHAAPGGLLPPLRQRHGRAAQPDRGRAGLVLQGGDRLHRLGGGRRRPRAGHGREAGAVRAHRARHPAPGKRGRRRRRGGGRGDQRDASPSLEVGIGMAYVRADLAEPGTEVEIDVRGKLRAARIESKPLYRKES